MKFRLALILSLSFVAATAAAAPLDNSFFIGVDGRTTIPSGTYGGLAEPNAGRLTLLFGHGDHYHGIGAYSYSGPAVSPTINPTNANNTIPELYTSLPGLNLTLGSGVYAGRYVSGLGTDVQDLEYGDLGMLATTALSLTGDPEDSVLFNSSAGRWTGALGQQQIGLELVSISSGLEVGDLLGNTLFPGGVGSIETLGVGDLLDFEPVFFTAIAGLASYSATFRLRDLGTAGGGPALFGDSGTFTFAFQVVPEPGTALLMGLGLVGLASVRRSGRA